MQVDKDLLIQKVNYRAEIDGFRAFAVLSVIINHFNKNFLQSGYLGVDIFFVISGFVITSSLAGRKSSNFKQFILSFYERRVKRLLPALVTFILISTIFICFFNPNPSVSIKTGFASLFGFSNIYLFNISTDYFAESTDYNLFAHTWSLGVEEQFYLIFPFIIWFTGFSRKKANGEKNLFNLLVFISSLSLISFIYIYSKNPSAAYFLTPNRFWEMSFGCLLFLISNKSNYFISKIKNYSPSLIIGLIIGVMFLPVSFAIPATILIVILSGVFILCIKEDSLLYNLFSNKKVVFIGLISYPLYLWHWGILVISRLTIGIHWWSIPIQLFLIYYISLLSYKKIESPFRKKEWSPKSLGTIIKGFLLLIISATSLIIFLKPLRGKLYLGNNQKNENSTDINWNFDKNNRKQNALKRNCHVSEKIKDFNEIDIILKECIMLNNENPNNKSIAFVGDSHTSVLASSQEKFYKNGWNVIHYSHSGCPFPHPINGVKTKSCDIFSYKATEKILEVLKKDDYVVINIYMLTHLGDYSLRNVKNHIYDKNKRLPKNGTKKLDIYTESLVKFARRAEDKGINIILFGAGMRNAFYQITAKEWFRPNPPSWIFSEEKENAKIFNNALKTRIGTIKNLKFFNTLEEIDCCDDHEKYRKYYFDGDHLTKFGTNYVMNKIIKLIE